MRSTIAMYRPIAWLSLVVSILWLPQIGLAAQGLVYRVQMEGRPTSYLVGTMHSEDERVTGLLAQFAPLIDRVDVVAVQPEERALTVQTQGTVQPRCVQVRPRARKPPSSSRDR